MRSLKLLIFFFFIVYLSIYMPISEEVDNEPRKAYSRHEIHAAKPIHYRDLSVEFMPMTTKLVFAFAIMAMVTVSYRKEFRSPVVKPAFWGAKFRTQTPRANLTSEHMFCII